MCKLNDFRPSLREIKFSLTLAIICNTTQRYNTSQRKRRYKCEMRTDVYECKHRPPYVFAMSQTKARKHVYLHLTFMRIRIKTEGNTYTHMAYTIGDAAGKRKRIYCGEQSSEMFMNAAVYVYSMIAVSKKRIFFMIMDLFFFKYGK